MNDMYCLPDMNFNKDEKKTRCSTELEKKHDTSEQHLSSLLGEVYLL